MSQWQKKEKERKILTQYNLRDHCGGIKKIYLVKINTKFSLYAFGDRKEIAKGKKDVKEIHAISHLVSLVIHEYHNGYYLFTQTRSI